jgi:hypothetical protein
MTGLNVKLKAAKLIRKASTDKTEEIARHSTVSER